MYLFLSSRVLYHLLYMFELLSLRQDMRIYSKYDRQARVSVTVTIIVLISPNMNLEKQSKRHQKDRIRIDWNRAAVQNSFKEPS